jgi:endonuclease YncB( thermonuclease family)
MSQGLLTVEAELDLGQFWPERGSDADTVVVTLKSPFKFRPHPGAPPRITRAFDGAKVRGSHGPVAPIKNQTMRVRLQGIDAPELHCDADPALAGDKATKEMKDHFKQFNREYRQLWAETAVVRFGAELKKFGAGAIRCTVQTAVDQPGEVWDMYARFVGDIVVGNGAKERNVNRWLLQSGWALPSFYTSMSDEEIEFLTKLAVKARNKKRGLWSHYTAQLGSLDLNVVYREPKTKPQPAPETGRFILPKLFRRQVTFTVNRQAKMVAGDFAGYLKAHRVGCYLTRELLDDSIHSAKERGLHEFLQQGKLTVQPEDVTFKEGKSRLIGADGKDVKAWW